MKILHCCLSAFYIDKYGYQENILPKHHYLLGHEVEILASTLTYINKTDVYYTKSSSYTNEDGIKVTRVPFSKILPLFINKKIRLYKNIYHELIRFSPDVIFMHDLQTLSIFAIRKYCKKNINTILYIDGHTDYINSGRNFLSKYILHKFIYRFFASSIKKYTKKFYGVTPLRCNFFHQEYKISKSHIELLELGLDDSSFDVSRIHNYRDEIRKKYNILNSEFVIITGGKIDTRKNIANLISVIDSNPELNIKLFCFGSADKQNSYIVNKYNSNPNIIFTGWISPLEISQHIASADLAFFPGTHSVVWEQTVALGIPAVFKYWDGIDHVDIGGNCLFLNSGSCEEILETIKTIQNGTVYKDMKYKANNIVKNKFLYSNIAKKSLK